MLLYRTTLHVLKGLGGLTESVAALRLHLLDIFTLLLPFHMELFVGFSAIPSSEPALSFYLIFIFQINFVSSRDKEIEDLTPNVTSYGFHLFMIPSRLAGTF